MASSMPSIPKSLRLSVKKTMTSRHACPSPVYEPATLARPASGSEIVADRTVGRGRHDHHGPARFTRSRVSGVCFDRRRAIEAAKPQVRLGESADRARRIVGVWCYYDPTTGQFLSRDPMEASTPSAYGYVYGNPLNSIDPSGLWTCAGGLFCDAVNGAVSVATGGSADCLTNMTCNEEKTSVGQAMADEFRGDHPEAAQGVVDFSSGMLDFNPITMATDAAGWSDTSQYANTCSGWYHAGQATMIAIDIWAGGGLNASRFRDSRLFGKASWLFGRGGKAGGGALNHTALRIGWGWKGSATAGQDVFRIGLGNRRWHLEIWEVGKALRG